MLDQQATIYARFSPRTHPGPLGRQYLELSDKLSAAMKADEPDIEKIGVLWRELDRLKVAIGAAFLQKQSQCTLDKLKLMQPEEQKQYLRGMAPMTREERDRIPVVVPPPPPRAPTRQF
jgi:hypothetical protein